jgi:hypothetical protein
MGYSLREGTIVIVGEGETATQGVALSRSITEDGYRIARARITSSTSRSGSLRRGDQVSAVVKAFKGRAEATLVLKHH